MRSRYWVLLFILILFGTSLIPGAGGGAALLVTGTASAAESPDWRTEFDDICGRTADAQSLSAEDLTKLMSRCDTLKPRIEKLGESERKVFLKRLNMCRELFRYVLESKDGGK